jgi:hypothetical protein
MAMSSQTQKYKTQWACQFYAAAELTRRGYLVSLTFGNAPVADLLVVSPKQKHFMVDVKGQSSRNFWLMQYREIDEELFYVLVYLPKEFAAPEFYILSCAEMIKRREAYRKHIENGSGKYHDQMGGFNFGDVKDCISRWDKLPA